ncbi:MAG: tetratricopeptide repeat-containing sensor histidine kinase [Bacteroidia bacterium]
MNKLVFVLLFGMSLLSCDDRNEEFSTPQFDQAVLDLNIIRSEKYITTFLYSLDSAFDRVEQKLPLDWYHYYEFRAWYFMIQRDMNTALLYTDSMLQTLTPLPGIEAQYANALIQKGILLQHLNLYSAALNEFYTAGSYAERFLDPCGSVRVYNNVGIVLVEQGNYEEAIYYLEKARQGAMGCDSTDFADFFVNLQSIYNSIGLCHERRSNLDSAKFYYQEGLAFINRYEGLYPRNHDFILAARGVFYGNLGNTELLAGNYDRAEELLLVSIGISMEKGHFVNDGIYTRIKLGRLALERGQLKRLPPMIDSIKANLNEYPDNEAWKRLHALEVNYFLAVGDSSKAFLAREEQLKMENKLASLKKELPSLNIPASLSYFRQKEELKDLHETNTRNYIIIGSAILLLLLMTIIGYLFRKNWLNAKEHAAKLANINEELRQNNDQLMQLMENLESSQEENTRIMKVIAHDLRSPVAGIQGVSSLILDTGEELPKELKEEVKMIQRISNDSLKFIDDLLNTQGNFRNEEKKETDLLELIDYCVNFMQLRADEKKQHIHVSGSHVFVPVYRERIWRVFNNLVSNAIKFSQVGGEINIRLQETSTHVRIEVQDNGMGIPAKMGRKIFDVMGDNGRTGTAGERSFGLGLAISLQIMEAHEGRIWFESEEGRGTTFFVEFPKRAKG